MPIGSVAARTAAWLQRGGQFSVPAGGGGPLPVTFGITSRTLSLRVRLALGADLTASPLTWAWVDVTPYCRFEAGITAVTGRRGQASLVDPGNGRLTLNNRDGRFSRRNPSSPYYGLLTRNTPIWVTADPGSGEYGIMHMFVNEWPKRWDRSGNDAYIPIVASGIMRRLAKGRTELDPFTEAISATITPVTSGNIVAFWPCTDAASATTAASTISTVAPMTTYGTVTFAAVTGPDGSAELPSMAAGGQLIGDVPTGTVTDQFTVGCWAKGDSSPTANAAVLTVECAGSTTARTWVVRYASAGTIDVIYYNSTPDSGTTTATASLNGFNGTFRSLQLRCRQNGGSADVALYVDGTLVASSSPTVTLARPTRVLAGDSMSTDLTTVGQVQVYASYTPSGSATSGTSTSATIDNGFDGELAHERMARICAQAGIQFACAGSATPPMGVMTSGTILDQLRACEAVDGGVLYEHEWGLAYQTRGDRENTPVAITLDVAESHVKDKLEPADDDQRYRNQWTVSRTGGSSATARLDDDILEQEGVVDEPATVNVDNDTRVYAQASYRVWRDSRDEDRWPDIPINLAATPDLIATYVGLGYGARLAVVNLPSQADQSSIDTFIEGKTEKVTGLTWDVVFNTSPARPYDVLLLAESSADTFDGLGRTVADSCVLAVAVDTTGTSWSVSTTPLCDTDPNQYPYNIYFGPELITVTACSGGSNPQTWTVTRSVNGVVASHDVGAEGELADPLIPVLP